MSVRHCGGRLGCAALLVGLAGCSSSAGGYDFTTLGFTVSDQAQQTTNGCEQLPVLWGSERLTHYDIAGEFTVIVRANNREARVTFEDIVRPERAERIFAADDIAGGWAEEVTVETTDGDAYNVSFTSGCSDGS